MQLNSALKKYMYILGIETSCDDTGIAVYAAKGGLLAHALHSQNKLHADYGGVVPELASREHIRRLTPLTKKVLEESGITYSKISGIAYTSGPGLMGSLLVGAAFACSLGLSWKVPTLGIHHLEGHLLAAMLEQPAPEFPFLTLLVSGGHSMLIAVKNIGEYKILGETLDDAAGEAFDKTAKLLGLPYPGGAHLEVLAAQGQPDRLHFPRPMTDRPGLDFSFSGLKTFASNTLKKEGSSLEARANVAYAFQEAVVETLSLKCIRALAATGLSRLVIAGGVGANRALRSALLKQCRVKNIEVFFPRPSFCTDNGAMIAYAGFCRMQKGQYDKNHVIQAYPRWDLEKI